MPAVQLAIEQLIDRLEDECWVRLPDHDCEFILYTDYSGYRIGGVLMQKDCSGSEWPVCMVSRSLTDTEQAYAHIEGEALALVWSKDHLPYLIEGRPVLIKTDHKPLICIFHNGKGKSKLTRWALKLQAYDLTVEYVRGKANTLADFSSQVPLRKLPGLIDGQAFDLSDAIPPLAHVFTALEEQRDDFNEQLEQHQCLQCHVADDAGGQDPMLVCDWCGDVWHQRCAGLEALPSRYQFCAACQMLIRERNERNLIYNTVLLDFLELGVLLTDPDKVT